MKTVARTDEYTLAARRIAGTRAEKLAQIDAAIQAGPGCRYSGGAAESRCRESGRSRARRHLEPRHVRRDDGELLPVRDELREGQRQLLTRVSVQLPAVLSHGAAHHAAGIGQGHADVYADERHPADRGLQQFHVQSTNQVHSGDPSLSLDGVGAYARYQVTTPAALAIRYEYLDDEGLFAGIAQTLQECTATAEYKFTEGFLIRGEFRRDWSNQVFFPVHDGGMSAHQNTALVGLVWWIGNKTGGW